MDALMDPNTINCQVIAIDRVVKSKRFRRSAEYELDSDWWGIGFSNFEDDFLTLFVNF